MEALYRTQNYRDLGKPSKKKNICYIPSVIFQNDSEWLEMDFKHNFSQCNILTRSPPPPNVTFVTFFLKASLKATVSLRKNGLDP